MTDKLKSRKFWMALLGALLPIIGAALTKELNWGDAITRSVAVVVTYLAGQAYADGKAVEGRTDLTGQGATPALPAPAAPPPT